MLLRIFGLVLVALLMSVPGSALSGSPSRATADALASLIRNASAAKIKMAEPEFSSFLKAHNFTPDLSSVLALAMAPVTLGASDDGPDHHISVAGACQRDAVVGGQYRCSIEINEISAKGPDGETESTVVLKFRLDRRPDDPAASVIGPVEIFFAG